MQNTPLKRFIGRIRKHLPNYVYEFEELNHLKLDTVGYS